MHWNRNCFWRGLGKFSPESVERGLCVLCSGCIIFPNNKSQTDYPPEWPCLPQHFPASNWHRTPSEKKNSRHSFAKITQWWKQSKGLLLVIFLLLASEKHLCPHTTWETEIEHRYYRGLFTSAFSFLPKGFPWASLCQQCEFSPYCYISLPSGFSPSPLLIYSDDGHQWDSSFVWLGWQTVALPLRLALIGLRGDWRLSWEAISSCLRRLWPSHF